MIIKLKDKEVKDIDYKNFGNEMIDGRMTEESDGKIYKLRDAIMYSRILGRELTDREGKVMSVDDSIKDFIVKRNAWKSKL